MTCGCKANPGSLPNAAICASCTSAVDCPADGHPVEMHVRGLPCRRGKHPGKDGTVRWLGIRWIGVPYPLRWWLWTLEFNERDPWEFVKKFPGCGCWKWAKDRLAIVFTNWSAAYASDPTSRPI